MRRNALALSGALLVAMIGLAAAGCGGGQAGTSTPEPASMGQAPTTTSAEATGSERPNHSPSHIRKSGTVTPGTSPHEGSQGGGQGSPPNGAFRGFGAPQTQFASEVHMERIAERLGMDPVKLREINALRAGDTTATGQVLGRDTSALKVLREAVARTDFKRRRRELRGTNRGLGLALFFHGAGFTGSGEVRLASKASLELTERGARILVASAEIGQGSRTVHAQIVADTLGCPYDAVEVARADTARRSRQRTDRRLAHLDGRRRAPAAVRRRDEAEAGRTRATRVPAPPRPAGGHQAVRGAHRGGVRRRRRTAATRTAPTRGAATWRRSNTIR